MKLEQPILPHWMHGTWKTKRTKQTKNYTTGKERGWFSSLHDNHVLYTVLCTPTSLPMITQPRADKIVISIRQLTRQK